MTESEWVTCDDPTPMLRSSAGRATPRKMRLFGCACCHRIWNRLGPAGQAGVIAIEGYSDGLIYQQQLETACRRTGSELTSQVLERREATAVCATTAVVSFYIPDGTKSDDFLMNVVNDGAEFAASAAGEGIADQPCVDERKAQASLLRDVMGFPFPPTSRDLTLTAPDVCSLARTIYGERAFDRMRELANVLERAGCTNAGILEHCRGPGPHVRGCWVVDLILGKS